jgi:uncharacterized protein
MKLDYDEVNVELGAVHAGMRASECHGFLCGHFCVSNTIAVDSWRDHLLAGIDDVANVDDCFAILTQLANQVKQEILSEEISFALLLPDDESAIDERSSALAEWCAGFTSGLGIGGLGEKSQLNDECDEFVKDVVSISRMETAVEDGEDAEFALFEIIEYIRVGTIMLHQEWHSILTDNERPDVLH